MVPVSIDLEIDSFQRKVLFPPPLPPPKRFYMCREGRGMRWQTVLPC
jgi:hypothetical protein